MKEGSRDENLLDKGGGSNFKLLHCGSVDSKKGNISVRWLYEASGEWRLAPHGPGILTVMDCIFYGFHIRLKGAKSPG